MKWDEFRDLLTGLGPDTALGRVVAIRSEDDKGVLKHFTKDQMQIRNKWRARTAKKKPKEDLDKILEALKNTFISMAGA